jgi:hypothetical protein
MVVWPARSGCVRDRRDRSPPSELAPSPPAGEPAYHLPTTTKVSAKVGQDTYDERVTKTDYNWVLRKPSATITEGAGAGFPLKQQTFYDNSTGLVVETRMPSKESGGDASATRTLYYTIGAHPEDAECGGHGECANLVCKTGPAAQPTTPGLPDLPVTRLEYNRLNEVTTETETVGSDRRVSTTTYDAAGRERTKSVTSTVGEPVPTVTTEYDPSTGRPTTITADGKTIVTGYDCLGRAMSYKDAAAFVRVAADPRGPVDPRGGTTGRPPAADMPTRLRPPLRRIRPRTARACRGGDQGGARRARTSPVPFAGRRLAQSRW